MNSAQQSPVKFKFTAVEFEQKLTFICQFCGGATCKLEDYRTNTKVNAIEGLHSNWITDNILAMQRPSERLIKQFNLYQSFKKNKITAILNLQQPGEHPYCGDGIAGNSGFSYIPEYLYPHQIAYFNLSWEDMTATTSQYMMKIMNVFDYAFQRGGRIAVHCHAGRGRTLLAICSWLIYNNQFNAQEVVKLAIEKRDGVLSKNSQIEFLYEFEKFLKARRRCYGLTEKTSFEKIISKQQEILLRKIKAQYQSVPVVQYSILKSIRSHLQSKKISAQDIEKLIMIPYEWTQSNEEILHSLKMQFNQMQPKLSQIPINIMVQALFDFYDELPYNPLTMTHCEIMQKSKSKDLVQMLCQPELVNLAGVHILCAMLDFAQFAWDLKNKYASEQFQGIITRFVKCLLSKKKYCKECYSGRHLKPNINLTAHQRFLKEAMVTMAKSEHEIDIKATTMRIKKISYDIYFHRQEMLKTKQNELFSQAEMMLIYSKCGK